MKKLFLKFYPFIAASVIFAGCGSSDSSSPGASSAPVSAAPVSATGCPDPVGSELDITPRYSQAFFWCWAASAEMCIEFLSPGNLVCQCDEANHAFNIDADCCSGDVSFPSSCNYFYYPPDGCDHTHFPDFPHYGFNPTETSDAPISFAEIENQISCNQEPVAFSWHWVGGGGHMMVIKGYTADSLGMQWVSVLDPDTTQGLTEITYEEYDTDMAPANPYILAHYHWNDFYDFKKAVKQ